MQGILLSQTSNSLEPSRYIFRQGGHHIWEFAFDSAIVRIGKDLKGFEHLARLISRPGVRISPFDLAHIEQGKGVREAAAQEGRDNVIDKKAEKCLRKRKKELQELLATREDSAAEAELRKIVEYLGNGRRPGGQSTKLGASPFKNACQSVQNAIQRALEAFEKAGLTALAKHLASCKRPDFYEFVYREENPPDWEVTWLTPFPPDQSRPPVTF